MRAVAAPFDTCVAQLVVHAGLKFGLCELEVNEIMHQEEPCNSEAFQLSTDVFDKPKNLTIFY